MILRVALLSLILLGLGGFGTVAWVMLAQGGAPAIAAPPVVNRVAVLTVTRPLHAGMMLKTEDLTTSNLDQAILPAGYVPDAVEARRALLGGVVRRTLATGAVLTLPDDALRPTDRGFMAAVLSPGSRAVSVAVDAVSGAAGLIWPGDRIDLILTQSIDDPTLAPGHRVAAETVLRDVRVIAVDQQVDSGSPSLPETPPAKDLPAQEIGAASTKTVTLEVMPDQAEFVAVAAKLGHLSLALRAAVAGPAGARPPATVWASDVSVALPNHAAPAAIGGLRVYQGAADAKEFKF